MKYLPCLVLDGGTSTSHMTNMAPLFGTPTSTLRALTTLTFSWASMSWLLEVLEASKPDREHRSLWESLHSQIWSKLSRPHCVIIFVFLAVIVRRQMYGRSMQTKFSPSSRLRSRVGLSSGTGIVSLPPGPWEVSMISWVSSGTFNHYFLEKLLVLYRNLKYTFILIEF